MSTTSDFLKLRSNKDPEFGIWNSDLSKTKKAAKNECAVLITCWSNGDNCGYCINTEKCMMEKTFTNWMKKSNCYFCFQCSADKDKGQKAHDFVYNAGKISMYPGFRLLVYGNDGKVKSQTYVEGNTLTNKEIGKTGAKNMVNALKEIINNLNPTPQPVPPPDPEPIDEYVVRLNEKLTTAQVNKVLDAIDKNNGYCPCQAGQSDDTKCHCKDFRDNKKIGEPCICNIYVKKAKS